MAMSDRIIVMHKGVIQQVGGPTEIYDVPVNKIIADFIGLVNFVDGEVHQGELTIRGFGDIKLTVQAQFEGKAVAAIRPEHIGMSAQPGGLRGTVAHKFYLGDSIDWRIEVNGTMIRVVDRVASYNQFATGEEIRLDIQKAMVFPA